MHFALVRTSALSEFNRLTWPAANPFYVGRPVQRASTSVSIRIGRAAYVLLTRRRGRARSDRPSLVVPRVRGNPYGSKLLAYPPWRGADQPLPDRGAPGMQGG